MATVIYKHEVTTKVVTPTRTLNYTTRSYEGDGLAEFSGSIAGSTSNKALDIKLDVSQIKSLTMQATVAMTLRMNASGTPYTISLPAGKEIVWNSDASGSNPFTTDVEEMDVSNSGQDAGDLNISIILDRTP